MNCAEARTLLHAFADGELDLVHSLQVETHAKECEVCARELAQVRALSSALREGPLYRPAPSSLQDRIRNAIEPEGHASVGIFGFRPRLEWLLAAAAVLVVVMIARIEHSGPSPIAGPDLAANAVADHIRSLMADHLTDVLSSNRHTVKPWFDGKLDFAPIVQDLSSDGFVLVGGRLDYLDGRPVAAIVYRRGAHTINLFEWPVASSDEPPVMTVANGYNVVDWTERGMKWYAVSDVSAVDLKTFAELLRRSAAT
jgi:anti-sigma factor RsiW